MSKETKPAPKMSAKKKPSSVQMLKDIYFKTGTLFETDFERSEEMHEVEIVTTYYTAQNAEKFNDHSSPKDYYTETFGGNNE